ncbi:hypothetical protein Syun_003983 [Stephania yunnanensis]|uniref:Uncharacterized protein n=1 Tax=Stephania yunnanensis TaxID=152371 RepID=A0AAP0L2G3_9MAGN
MDDLSIPGNSSDTNVPSPSPPNFIRPSKRPVFHVTYHRPEGWATKRSDWCKWGCYDHCRGLSESFCERNGPLLFCYGPKDLSSGIFSDVKLVVYLGIESLMHVSPSDNELPNLNRH